VSASVACAVGCLSVSFRALSDGPHPSTASRFRLLVVDAIRSAVHVVDVVVVGEAAGVDGAGDESATPLVEVGSHHEPFEHGPDRRTGQRHADKEADGVGDEAGREQEGARGDQQAAVHEFLRRHLARREPSLEAPNRVAALRADQQHADETGEDDQRDGRRRADGVGDDDEKQGVGQGDEQQECEHPAQAHTLHYRVPTHSPFDAGRSP